MKVLKSTKKKAVKGAKKVLKRGLGVFDKLIDKLPIELHLRGYNYCGPGIFLQIHIRKTRFTLTWLCEKI